MHRHRLNSHAFTHEHVQGDRHVSQHLLSKNAQAESISSILDSTGALKEPLVYYYYNYYCYTFSSRKV